MRTWDAAKSRRTPPGNSTTPKLCSRVCRLNAVISLIPCRSSTWRKFFKALARHGRDWLRQIRQVAQFYEPAPPESQLAKVVRAPGGFKLA